VLRHLIIAMNEPVVAPSPMMKEEKAKSLAPQGAPAAAASPVAAPAPAIQS
jgi:small subunit ribosomal protein S6